MIVVLTPNPAWDRTYRVPSLVVGDSHRVAPPVVRAGGKGINTAGVLRAMGVPSRTVAPVGAGDRAAFAADLDARGMEHDLEEVEGLTRSTVAFVDDAGRATLFNESGAPLSTASWSLWESRLLPRLAPRDVLVVAGSLPPGVGGDEVCSLVGTAQAEAARVVIDIGGPPLVDLLSSRPHVVTPNRVEAAAALARPAETPAPELVLELHRRGAQAAIVSDGAAGLVLATTTDEGLLMLRARVREPLRGNATGAGDALTAALAAGLGGNDTLTPDGWRGALVQGCSWAGAAVLQPVAGSVNPRDVARLQTTVDLEEMHP